MPAQSENIGLLNSQSADFTDYTDSSDIFFVFARPAKPWRSRVLVLSLFPDLRASACSI